MENTRRAATLDLILLAQSIALASYNLRLVSFAKEPRDLQIKWLSC